MNSELVKENRNGYYCVWLFKCKMCNKMTKIESERTEIYIPINKAIVIASIGIGIGYSQLNEFSAILDVPCLSSNTYEKLFGHVSENIEQTAWEQMRLAGIEEKRLAIEAGDIDSDGIPLCPVIADGQWGKRSYKSKYNALSGAVSTDKKIFVVIEADWTTRMRRQISQWENIIYYVKNIIKHKKDELKLLPQGYRCANHSV